MDSLIKVSVVLMLCEIGSAKDLLKYIQGNNATVYLDELQTDVNATLEINFSGYTSNRHFTNVMIYNHENGKEEKVSINSNYTGRIQRIVMSNGNLSFLLLNASFNDSGKYTAKESSIEKRNTSVLVVGRILSAYLGERITHSFIFSETTTSSIKIEFVTSSVRRTALFYNVSKGDCNSADVSIVEDIEMRKCERKTDEFSFTFPNITWLHKGGYFAWDEKGRLLDSIFIDVVEMDKASPSISNAETDLTLTISIQKNKATVYIGELQTDGDTFLEISFSGYTSYLHFTEVMKYVRMKGQKETISINSNYTGRIQKIAMNNGHFSFLLVNVTFKDSGHYTVKVNSFEKRHARVFVARRIIVTKLRERCTLSFLIDETTMSSITIGYTTSKGSYPVGIYNSSNGDCTYQYVELEDETKLQTCTLKKGEFSFDIEEIIWFHKGLYCAWGDKGRLLDCLFVDVEVNNTNGCLTTLSNLDTENYCLSTRHFVYIGVGLGALISASFLSCFLQHRFRFCSRENRPSNSNHTKAGRDENLQDISLERYGTIASDEKG